MKARLARIVRCLTRPFAAPRQQAFQRAALHRMLVAREKKQAKKLGKV